MSRLDEDERRISAIQKLSPPKKKKINSLSDVYDVGVFCLEKILAKSQRNME